MYLLVISLGLIIAYVGLIFLFSFFFKNQLPAFSKKSIWSILLIFLLSILVYIVVMNISDLELGNRILHAFGGGFLAMIVCFLAIRDGKIKISKFQFLVISVLVVTSLGVANEILEFFLQNYGDLIAATSINDTWYDLISNAIGSLLGVLVLTPFIPTKRNAFEGD